MSEQPRHLSITSDQLLYLRARMALVAFLLLLVPLGVKTPGGPQEVYFYLALLGIIVAGTIALYFVGRYDPARFSSAMMWALLPDLVSVAGFSYFLRDSSDAFYPVAVLLPVSYALVVSKRDAWLVGGATAVAYVVGYSVAQSLSAIGYLLLAIQSVAIPGIGLMVATSVERQRSREAETRQAVADKESANTKLQRRVQELQAVSQITEIVHSSLDFERVGPVVLSILAKVIGVEQCCLFVIDKDKSETLFSASYGFAGTTVPYGAAELEMGMTEEHFACSTVFDHMDTMVLFCATAEDLAIINDEDSLVLGAVASELVVAVENSRLYRLTKKLAVTDELTSLANYRHLQTRLDEEIERARRYDKRLSLLMLDVDDFKRFNDTQGHIAGDSALADLAQVLLSRVREVDLVARYGGEEFAVVLPETDASGAFVAAEKIRECVSEHRFRDADGEACMHLTVSLGLATFPTHAWDKESLLREADDALYNAKNGGKDRVRTPSAVHAEAPSGEPAAADEAQPDFDLAEEPTGD